jgi:hypothetical protein
MVVSKGRGKKYVVRGSLGIIAVIAGAQIYALRELLFLLLILWLFFLVLWIGLSSLVVLYEMSRRGLHWLATHATPIVIRRHPMVRVSTGIDSGHADN